MVVRDAGQAVLAPAIGPRPRMLVGEELPRGAVGAVVLPHRPPLPLAQEGTPAAPVGAALLSLFQTLLFRLHAFRVPRRPHAVEAVPESLRRAATPSQPPVNSLTPPTRCQIVGALVRAAYPTARRPEGLVVSIRRLPVAVAGSDAPGHGPGDVSRHARHPGQPARPRRGGRQSALAGVRDLRRQGRPRRLRLLVRLQDPHRRRDPARDVPRLAVPRLDGPRPRRRRRPQPRHPGRHPPEPGVGLRVRLAGDGGRRRAQLRAGRIPDHPLLVRDPALPHRRLGLAP